MIFKPLRLFSLLISITFALDLYAQPIIPNAPELGAKSWILIDASTGEVLASAQPDAQIPPASLTKIMTSYIVAGEIAEGRLSLDQQLEVSSNAWRKGGARTGGSTMFLNEKSMVSVDDLLHGLVVQSGNDAAIVLAEHIGATEDNFAGMMNQQAAILGMNNTHFVNSTGWPDEQHYSSAADMALLTQALIRDYPEHYKIYSEKSFTYNGISQRNRNSLLWQDSSVDGVKTGSTEEAGYCLIVSAVRHDMRLISAVMGAGNSARRVEDSKKLLAWGFRYFRTTSIYESNEVLQTERLWKGSQDSLDVGLLETLELTLPRNIGDRLNVELSVDNYLEAPIAYGDRVGSIKVSFSEEVLYEGSLISLESVNQSALFSRIWDIVNYFFFNLWNETFAPKGE